VPVDLSELPAADNAQADAVLIAIDDALRRMEASHPRQCRVVECRFYGGLSVEETAAALALSPRTIKRDWAFAQAWLKRELGR
jgi:RNA polymerase sigma factor (sigma-70 family)